MSLPPAQVLPQEARELLMRAAKIQDVKQRNIAIADAVRKIKIRYPQYFNHDKE